MHTPDTHVIKVVIADDHTVFRTGIKTCLAAYDDIQMVAEADNGMLLLSILKLIKVDVVLLDIQMPVMDGLATLAEIKKSFSDIKVIMLSMNTDHRIINRMMELGADGYLAKESDAESIYKAIKICHYEGPYINDLTSKAMLSELKIKKIPEPDLKNDRKKIIFEKIKNVIDEMIDNADELPRTNFSDYVSKKLNYDYTYLSNRFSEVKGVTIEQYIIARRIERVKKLLLNYDLNLTQISYKLNYSSVAHLSNQFKKVTGFTPTHFKELIHKRNSPIEKM